MGAPVVGLTLGPPSAGFVLTALRNFAHSKSCQDVRRPSRSHRRPATRRGLALTTGALTAYAKTLCGIATLSKHEANASKAQEDQHARMISLVTMRPQFTQNRENLVRIILGETVSKIYSEISSRSSFNPRRVQVSRSRLEPIKARPIPKERQETFCTAVAPRTYRLVRQRTDCLALEERKAAFADCRRSEWHLPNLPRLW
jgi:hypothetical protein